MTFASSSVSQMMQLHESDFIFSNRPWHRLARHVMFWLSYLWFSAVIYGIKPSSPNDSPFDVNLMSFRNSLSDSLFFLPSHIFLSYVFMYLLIPRYIFTGKYGRFMLALMAAVLVTAAFSSFVSQTFISPYHGMSVISAFYYGLMGGLRGSLSIAGFAGAIKMAKYWYRKEQQNRQLEAEKLKAELQLLKAQVHPHFLFNTLNNLYSLTLERSSLAPEVVLKLSNLLRFMLYECNEPAVCLTKEIRFIQDYIELEQLRYGARLDLSLHITGNPENKCIAPLLLIPFLENSFKHGASEQLDQAWINIELTIREYNLVLKVVNAINPEVTKPGGQHGIGLRNVQKRLQFLYPERHTLRILQEEEMYLVSLMLQLDAEAPTGFTAPATIATAAAPMPVPTTQPAGL